ncbi:MAG: hypothetical protein A3K83_02030 [Omnitrophica WOR_2 bacterium RBG_13_44_8b]|nr:MAG: hypothetical protein A3K83_02030 [Omnitrophica WOR_2 bacterium RBG_13_44_8b]
MKKSYKGPERRKFVRLNCVTPLDYKVCKKTTIAKLLQGYIHNISQSGLFCKIRQKVKKNDLLWISFDRTTLGICTDIEKSVLIHQNGIVGKVIRVVPKGTSSYDVGLQFITREEKNLTHIFPKFYFAAKGLEK